MIRFVTCLSRTLCAAGLTCLAVPAMGADTEGKYALEGPGRISCAAFSELSTQDATQLQTLAGWTLGYISAHNRFVAETYDLTSWQNVQTLMALARQYCDANAESSFEIALLEVMKWAAASRLVSESQLVSIGTDDKTVVLYQSTIETARQKLTDKGYDTGSSDTELASALRAYQLSEKLEATGLLDQSTLARLLR